MRFLSKALTVFFKEKKGFDYKNNYKYDKLANFCLDNIFKINYKILVILLYILSKLELRKL